MTTRMTRLIVTAALAWPLGALAQGTMAPAGGAPAPTVSKKEQHFVATASEGGMAEIQLSQLALKTSQNSDVKTFAQKMVDDHTKAGDALAQIATKDNITTPTTLDKHHQDGLDKLSKLSGAKFDAAYMKTMVSDHDSTAKALQKEIDNGKDPDITGWAKTTLPTVQSHDQMAHQLQATVTKSM